MQTPQAGGSATVGSAASANVERRTPNFGQPFSGALSIGGQQPIVLPRGGNVTSYNPPIVALKRGRIDNIVGGDASIRRVRANIGGTSDREMAAMNGTVLASNAAPIQFGDSTPVMSSIQAGVDGAAQFANFATKPYDEAYRGVGPIGGSAFPGTFAGFPGKTRFFGDSSGTQFAHTLGAGLFQASQQNGGAALRNGDMVPPVDLLQTALNTTRSNRTGGHAPRIKYTYTLAPENFKVSANELTGMPIVHEVTHLTAPNEAQLFYGLDAAPTPQVRIYDVTTANWLMATEQPRPTNPEDVVTPQELMTKYRLTGSGASDEGHQYRQNGEDRNVALTARNVVVNHGGEALQLYNFWGAVPYAHMVGFILKGVSMSNIWALNPHNIGTYNLSANTPNAVQALNTKLLADVVLQFVPWKSPLSGDTPKLADLVYYDDFGVQRLGIWIPFATVLQTHGDLGHDDDIDRAPFSIASAHRAGKLTAIISRKQPLF